MRSALVFAAAFLATLPLTVTGATGAPPAEEPSLEELRQITSRFRDVNVALAEGYVRDPLDLCDTAEMMGRPAELGAMGIHFFRPDLLGLYDEDPSGRVNGNGTHTDFRRPSILIYEPQEDGSLELVAVENLVFDKAWRDAGHEDWPTYLGVSYIGMADDPATEVDEAHLFQPHHDLHVWVHRENPNGMFAPFNPTVKCDAHNARNPHLAKH